MTPTRTDIAELFLRVVRQVTRAIAADVRRSEVGIEPIYYGLQILGDVFARLPTPQEPVATP